LQIFIVMHDPFIKSATFVADLIAKGLLQFF